MLYITLLLLGLFAIAVVIFINTAPQFGQKPQGADLERIKKSINYSEDKFINQIKTKMGSFSEIIRTLPDFFRGRNGKPQDSLQVKFGQNNKPPMDSLCFVTWYGHSAFLIELEGKRILLDPMLTKVSSPVSFGTKRFNYKAPVPIEELTDIDAIILSHDHYDHLDYRTILMLKKEVKNYYTALGVGSHLRRWGIPADKITELDWWQQTELDGITLVSCPARHFSGRGLTDRDATQWSSWVIRGNHQNLYFSGDSGYGPHFKEVGEKYGPFDLAMMECGQYNQAWEAIHMMPEQSVRAGIDVKGKVLMPIHWGAFKISVHEWTDPIIRFKAESERLDIPIVHPYIGERFCLGRDVSNEEWWK